MNESDTREELTDPTLRTAGLGVAYDSIIICLSDRCHSSRKGFSGELRKRINPLVKMEKGVVV